MTATHPLALHHLTALDADPISLIRIAAELGCSHVGLFTHLPATLRVGFPAITTNMAPSVATALADLGITVNNIEVFALKNDLDVASCAEGLAIGAQLGAKCATVHVHEPDFGKATALLADFCTLAAGYGIAAALEFTSFAAVRSLDDAMRLLSAVAHPNARLAIDFLHLMRNGGTVSAVRALNPDLIAYVQLCDGMMAPPADLYEEAVANRLLPGLGEFPLAALLEALPAKVIVDIEVPQHAARDAGLSARDRAARALTAGQRLLTSVTTRPTP